MLSRAIDQAHGLSGDELVRMAFDRSPDLRALEAGVAAARGREQQAASRSNPTASLGREDQLDGPNAATSIGVSWALDLWRLAPRRDAAAASRSAEEATLDDAKRRLAADVYHAYGRVLAAARTLTTTLARIDTASSLLALVEARVTAGKSPALERDQAAIEVGLLERERHRDEAELDVARLALAALIGLPPEQAPAVRGTIEELAESPEPLPAAGVTPERSDVRAAEARQMAAAARARESRADGRTDVGLFGQFTAATTSLPFLAFTRDGTLAPIGMTMHTFMFGVSFTLPILNRQAGATRAAIADQEAAAQDLERVRLDVDHAVAASRVRVDAARAGAAALRSEALTRARDDVGITREAYTLGSRSMTDVLAAVQTEEHVDAAYTDVLLELFQARVDLRAATGDIIH